MVMKEIQDFLGFDAEEVHKYEKEYFDYQQSREGFDITFYGNWQRDFAKLLIEIAEFGPKELETFLDVGCACGINLRGMDELGIFAKLYGTDISNYIINTVIPSMPKHEWSPDSSYTDFYATPSHNLSMIEDDTVDLLACTNVLEHITSKENLIKTLEEFKRVLHPEGKIIIILPVEDKEPTETEAHNHLHQLMHTSKWWSKEFTKHFRSESFKARIAFKKSKLKPDRDDNKNFYENYPGWEIFRLVRKYEK
jgi:ubiquinone/menaquinone biosynthesis C-methylase UbiE